MFHFSVSRLLPAMILLASSGLGFAVEVTPDLLEFRRHATRRMVFDPSQEIPLASMDPSMIVGFDLMHPAIGDQNGQTEFVLGDDALNVSAPQPAAACRWVGGFNPFATYDVDLKDFKGSGAVGLSFRDSGQSDRITASLVVSDGTCQAVHWVVVKDGQEVDRQAFELPERIATNFPTRFRVQMLAVGANLYVDSGGQSHLIGYPDFSQHFELRNKQRLHRYEFCLVTDLAAGSSVSISGATAALTPGCGQADIRAITRPDGEPLIDEGRLWFTMTVRGRALPHPLQGVFSMNPSVFDLQFEGIIVFDMGDGMLRNELASHLYYDAEADEWRGWTTGFSAFGVKDTKEEKAILAVSSKRDPRRGFSVMRARPIGLQGEHEDPHGIYDAQAGKWRLLLSERAGKYRAGMWESDRWDGGYTRLAGPVEMDSTGTLIQKIGSKRYALFGSADRKVYVRTYPDLKPAGELNIHMPPWNDDTGTRIWPNVIPLPEGYPSRYIALMMDRQNFPGMPKRNWTYGAMYLYHAQPPASVDNPYEYK